MPQPEPFIPQSSNARVHVIESSPFNPSFLTLVDNESGPAGAAGVQGPDGFGELHQDFVATPGQTLFGLSTTPADPNKVLMIVDHMLFYPNIDFTVSGNVVTWGGDFVLQAGQDVRIYYTDN